MIIHQTGLRVLGARVIGFILMTYAIISVLGAILLFVVSLLSNNLTEESLAGVAVSLIQALAFSWPAAFLLWMFPDIEVLQDSLRLKYLVFKWVITRDEILRMTNYQRFGSYAIFLKRKGLLLNMMYGLFFYNVMNQAVIIVCTDAKNIDYLHDFFTKM